MDRSVNKWTVIYVSMDGDLTYTVWAAGAGPGSVPVPRGAGVLDNPREAIFLCSMDGPFCE